MPKHVDAMVCLVIKSALHLVEKKSKVITDDDFKAVFDRVRDVLENIIDEDKFSLSAQNLARALPWGDFDRSRVINYYSQGLSDLSAANLVGGALYRISRKIGASTAFGRQVFDLSKKY